MSTPHGKTWVEVSRSALERNAATLQRIVGRNVKVMAVVKSNAYGHGTAETVRALAKAPIDWFGVDSLREAETVREAGSRKPILILGYTPLGELKRAVRQGFSLTVYNHETIAALVRVASKKSPALVHVKLETGTSRQGILAADLPAFVKTLRKEKRIVVEGLSTHYANIEDTTDSSYAMRQLSRFKKIVHVFTAAGIHPRETHTACSAAALLYPQTHFTMVRAGIALYGLWPSKETFVSVAQSGKKIMLHPALSWKTIIAQIKTLPAGASVSYGLTEKLSRDSKIAVIPVGYWDGFDRKLSTVGHVLIRGHRAKVLGRVCMNMCVVDVTDIPNVRVEDHVTIIGRQRKDAVTAEDVATAVGTINYEIVTRINPLTPRVLVA